MSPLNPTSDLQSSLATAHLQLCYQCNKCSAGCPLADAMDYLPHQLLKMVQVGEMREVLRSSTIWLCVGCMTCAVRCPMQLDLPEIMQRLCEQAVAEGVPAAEPRVAAFCDAFLGDVRKRGRVHELRQLLTYKLKSKDLLSDVALGIRMLSAGRLALRSDSAGKVDQVQALFEKFVR